MKYIQQQRPNALPPLEKSQQSINEEDRKKYGALLPKVGVYFLPDDKIIGMLK